MLLPRITGNVSANKGDRGILLDANGVLVDYCLEAHLDSGRCVLLNIDENGNTRGPGNYVVRGQHVPTIVVTKPAPMRWFAS